PHNDGAYGALTNINSDLPTVATILHSHGYNTAMVGKYQMIDLPQPGWDYWLNCPTHVDYIDPVMNDNGVFKTIHGHVIDIVTDTAVSEIAVMDTPFFFWVAHQAPHYPFTPQDQYAGMFANETINAPLNFAEFSENYPSFLYQDGSTLIYDHPDDPINQLHKYYECCYGLDESAKKILDALDQKGVLDNTLVIFTSDNGRFFGEHF